MIKVVGHRILVKPLEIKDAWEDVIPEDLKKVGFQVSVSVDEEKRQKLGMDRGTVVGIGSTCWKSADLGYGTDGWSPWCKVGDLVGYARYSGKVIEDPETKEEFYIMNDTDVQVIYKEA